MCPRNVGEAVACNGAQPPSEYVMCLLSPKFTHQQYLKLYIIVYAPKAPFATQGSGDDIQSEETEAVGT